MTKNQSNVAGFDYLKLIQEIWKKAWIVVLVSIFFAAVALAFTVYMIAPTYQASVLMYVNNSLSFAGFGISSGDLSTSKSLVDTYLVILKTRLSLEEIADVASVPYTYEQLSQMISASSVNGTEIFRVTVTSTNPYEACVIANSVAKVLPGKVEDVLPGASARVVDYAVVPKEKSAPSYTKNTFIGAVFGFTLVIALIVIKELFEDTIQSEDWLIESFDSEIPLLSTIPEEAGGKRYGKYYKSRYYNYDSRYGYYESKKKEASKDTEEKKSDDKPAEEITLSMAIGPKLGFTATEAYNLLRTNLAFTIPEKKKARVIGITSPNPTEGKSCCAINLCYSLANSGRKVLLIDCDLRKPTVAKRLKIKTNPGLSDAIIDLEKLTINRGVLSKNMDVLTSGSLPPNPSELVGSKAMSNLVQSLSDSYDYIIIDLPPVNTVADALIVSQVTDGIVVLIRHNFTRRSEVNEAIRQLDLAKSNIIGFVYNAYKAESGHYSYTHRGYYNRYGYTRYYSNSNSNKESEKKNESKA